MRPAWVVSSSSEVPSANSVMTDSSWSTASASLHSDPTQQSHLPYIKYGAGDVSSPGSFCISSSPNHHWAPQKLSEAAALKTYFPMTYFPPTITIPHFTPSHFTQPSSLTPTLPLDYDRSRVNDLQQRQRIKSVCLICGDRASGKHYGVFSCEGCKGFFKRTIRKELSYSCRHAGVCVIDKRQRNRCQACRFTKCQSMGMRREAVQEERISDRSYAQSDFSHTNSLPSLPSASPPICLNLSSPSSALSNCLPSSSNTATVSNTQTNSDPPHVGIKTEHSQQPGILRSLDEMATKESIGEDSTKAHTRHLCRWALSSPEFRLLGREHQAALLIHGWQDLILAEATYRTQPNSLRAEPNSSMLPAAFEVELETSPVITKLFSAINEMLVEKWHADSVRPDEIEALRFILLFNQDASSPGNPLPACVAASRQQQVTLLSKLSLSATLANPHPCPSRLARLLLRLPSLRTLAAQCMETLVIFPRRPMETDVIRILNGVASKYGNRPRELFSLL